MSLLVADVVTQRTDAAKFWLFLHILGGMVAVGALLLCVLALIGAWRSGSPALTRLSWRTFLYGAIPGFLLMRIAAQVVLNKEGLDSDEIDLTWVNIGFTVTDVGVLFLIIAGILLGVVVRRGESAAGPSVSARVATGLLSILLVAYLVAIWAMTTKPV
jgi:hypothetical protein